MSLVESKSSNRQQRDKIHRRIRRRNLHSKACSWCTHGAMEEKRNRGLEYPFTLCVYKLPIPQYSFLCVYHGPIFILPKLNEVFQRHLNVFSITAPHTTTCSWLHEVPFSSNSQWFSTSLHSSYEAESLPKKYQTTKLNL